MEEGEDVGKGVERRCC